MKILFKILLAIIGAVLLVAAALSVFVQFYLTDERVKKLVVPRLENALAREVRLEDISVSLWKGVTLKDIVILEADGQDEFIKVEGFTLSYDLLPLLEKKLRISRIVLDQPRIRVVRYANGKFNFESLKPLASPSTPKKPESAESPGRTAEAVLPLALSVSQIKVKEADLTLRDELKEIPAVMATVDGSVSLETGKNLNSLKYNGRLDIKAEAIYDVKETRLTGGSSFDQDLVDFNFDLQVDDQKMTLSGMIKDYLKSPDITCNLDSRSLNLDYLVAALGSVDQKGKKNDREKALIRAGGLAGQPVGTEIPEGFKAQGKVRVDKVVYRDLDINDFQVDYLLRNKVLELKDVSAHTAEGRIAGKASIDLDKLEPDYNATFAVRDVQLAPLQQNFYPEAGEGMSGNIIADFRFSGSGLQWPDLADTLNGEGTYKLLQGRIHQVEILTAIASLLQEKGLEDIYYEELSGKFRMRNGDIMLEASMDGEQVDVNSEGMVGLDGRLAMPLELRLSPELSKSLASRTSLSRHLMQEDGTVKLDLYLTGSLTSPDVSLDTAAGREKIKEKLTDTIRDKAREEIDQVFGRNHLEKEGPGEKDSPEEVVNEFIEDVLGN